MKLNLKQFGARLRSLREDKGLNMQQLANAIGVSNAAICKWENGTAEPLITNLYVLTEFFNCSADFLLCKTDDFDAPLPNDPMLLTVTNNEVQLLDTYRKLSESKQKLLRNTAKSWLNE